MYILKCTTALVDIAANNKYDENTHTESDKENLKKNIINRCKYLFHNISHMQFIFLLHYILLNV